MSRFASHFTDTRAEVFLPDPLEMGKSLLRLFNDVSPIDVGRDIYRDARAHIAQVRKEQEEFQQNLQAIGITRACRMTKCEIVELCSR